MILILRISDSEGYNYPSFMGMELVPGYLQIGVVRPDEGRVI